MFNDLVVVTKKNKEQYMFKQSFSLLNATAVSYQSACEFSLNEKKIMNELCTTHLSGSHRA